MKIMPVPVPLLTSRFWSVMVFFWARKNRPTWPRPASRCAQLSEAWQLLHTLSRRGLHDERWECVCVCAESEIFVSVWPNLVFTSFVSESHGEKWERVGNAMTWFIITVDALCVDTRRDSDNVKEQNNRSIFEGTYEFIEDRNIK